MEYPIHEVARAVGTTTRTLRHYDALGLVHPSRVGTNGYRYYDNHCLVRLQRVLLLRQLGLGLGTIRDVLEAQDATGAVEARILGDHLELLREEQRRLADQIGAVERTIAALKAAGTEGRNLMSDTIFDGFDHAQYKDEVEQRWGRSSYATSESWWQDLSKDGRAQWLEQTRQLGADWTAAAARGEDPASPTAHSLAARHVEWLRGVPGTPAHQEGGDLAAYVLGLGELYVADDRFAANYGGVQGATFVRDALRHWVATELD